jgi:stage V sporulation protein D (sporulation-specific penicillin-binding protein)
MQLVKAVSAIANDGVMVTPHIVKAIEDPTTGTITKVETNVERQVISSETASTMKDIMKDVVEKGGGTYAQVSGYTIGGKTGTAEPNPAHPEDGYVASFLSISPVENTELVCLFVLYQPTVGSHFGGTIAAPAVSQILSEVLPYLNIPSNNEKTNNGVETTVVPDVKNKTLADAKKDLSGAGLNYSCDGNLEDTIVDQVPRSGTKLTSGGVVKLYTSKNSGERVKTVVPDLKGFSFTSAKNIAEAKKLNISSTGTGVVIAQEPKANEEVQEGTVITVKLQEAVNANTQN